MIGKKETDPGSKKNLIKIYLQDKDGRISPIKQPIMLDSFGNTLLNGIPAQLVATEEFSMGIYDENHKQQCYFSHPIREGNDSINTHLMDENGASYIGVGKTNLDKILSIDVRIFGAHAIDEPGYENFDSAPAFREAIKHISGLGGGTITFSGNYKCLSPLEEYELPYDDGSISPEFINKGIDKNIRAEKKSTMPVCLEIPSHVHLTATNISNCSLDFGWDSQSGKISPTEMIGIVFRVVKYPQRTRMNTYVKSICIDNFTIKNAFIGWLSDGVMFDQSRIGHIIYNKCGIPAILL